MRANSPTPDTESQPYNPPRAAADPVEDSQEDQFVAMGTDNRWPEIVAYLRERQEVYRKYLPDGTAIATLSDREAGAWWKCAATVIAELDAFINVIEVPRDAARDSRINER
jgi:hypothetical protein